MQLNFQIGSYSGYPRSSYFTSLPTIYPTSPYYQMPSSDRPISMMASSLGNDSQTNVDQPFLARSVQPQYLQQDYNTPRDSTASMTEPLTTEKPNPSNENLHYYRGLSNESPRRERNSKRPLWKRPMFYLPALILLVIVIAAAVVIPIYFLVIKKDPSVAAATGGSNSSSPTSGGNNNPSNNGNPTSSLATTGGDGSLVHTNTGSSFIYNNTYGGYWVYDPNDPFNNGARPNSWTPPLNSSWTWGKDLARGVNLGGWFVIEPFITPAFFQKYPKASDEWTLSEAMAADTASGGLNQLETHYDTFITEEDFAQIAAAGLNWVRLPIPYWAVNKWEGEPFLEKVCWKYILRAIGWARKYGLRVNIDLHTVPGSQNGYNHSGKGGSVNFLNGAMGYANAQRTLDIIRIILEFISQNEYQNVVQMFGVVNEVLVKTVSKDVVTSFYLQVHNMARAITGVGAGKGPYISIHDGFQGLGTWANFLPGSDRIIMDTHPYLAFDGSAASEPIATGLERTNAGGMWPLLGCTAWNSGAQSVNNSLQNFGVTVAGEFSAGYNDCGKFLLGPFGKPNYYADCSYFEDSSLWNATVKAGLKNYAMAQMDALQNWFYWTWKIAPAQSGIVESPVWSYSLGLQGGWIPTDPREAIGLCGELGQQLDNPFDGNFKSWQTGGAGAGRIAASATEQFAWPPKSLNNVDAPLTRLPAFTATGVVATLPPPTFSPAASSSVASLNGWANPSDIALAATSISGCIYPSAWNANNVQATPCRGQPAPTAAPPPIRKRAM